MSRPYHQFCGVAKALDVVGERWTLLIVRDLLLGPRRFGELQGALAGIPPALLTERLKDLVATGVVQREGAGRRGAYGLTARGRELEPVVLALGRFGARYLDAPEPQDRLDMRWAMVSLKRRYEGSEARWRLQFDIGERSFSLRMGAEELQVWDGDGDAGRGVPDVVLAGSAKAFGAVLMGRVPVAAAFELGALEVSGRQEAVTDLLAAIGLG